MDKILGDNFPKEDTQILNKYITSDWKNANDNKFTMRLLAHTYQNEKKNNPPISSEEKVEQLKLSSTDGGNANQYSHIENQFGSS